MSKSERLNIRVTEDQLRLLKRAAEANGQTVSDYVLSHVLADAQDDLTDQRLFSLDAAEWAEFTSRLDRPAAPRPELEDLLHRPAPWSEAEKPDEVEAEAGTHQRPPSDLIEAIYIALQRLEPMNPPHRSNRVVKKRFDKNFWSEFNPPDVVPNVFVSFGPDRAQLWLSADAVGRERLPDMLREARPDFNDEIRELLRSVGICRETEDEDVPAARAD